MGDSMSDVLEELSGLLRRITEQNDASWETKREELRTPMNEFRSSAGKGNDAFQGRQDEEQQFRQRLLQTLDQHNQLLETLIARLRDNSKKGTL